MGGSRGIGVCDGFCKKFYKNGHNITEHLWEEWLQHVLVDYTELSNVNLIALTNIIFLQNNANRPLLSKMCIVREATEKYAKKINTLCELWCVNLK